MPYENSDTHTASDILKRQGILHFNESQTLSQVIPHLKSSHDAAFVFDDKDKFAGVVSPTYLLSKRALTHQTKLKSCLKMPPKLTASTPLTEVIILMLQSNLYYLPVLEDSHLTGIVTINRLLTYATRKKLINNNRIQVSGNSLITVTPETGVANALALMKQRKVAKLPVVDNQGALTGILSQFDLKPLVRDLTPWDRSNRSGEKESNLNVPVKIYMKKSVISSQKVPTFSQALSLMQAHNIGSIIIIDRDNKPMDIVTKRDLLQTILTSLSL